MRVIGFAGWSGAGKTTLLRKVIPRLLGRGVSVSTVKHAHHAFDVDVPGKDSWAHRQAGAHQVLVASSQRWALMHELRGGPEPPLAALLAKLDGVDLVLVEGFKRDAHPKVEIHQAGNGKPWLHPGDPRVLFVAADVAPPAGAPPWAHLDEVEAIADALLRLAEPVR